MIVLTRLNHSRFAVNPDFIERIQASPDTTLTLVGGSTYVVEETVSEVVDAIARYRARVIALAHDLPRSERLEVVANPGGELVSIAAKREERAERHHEEA